MRRWLLALFCLGWAVAPASAQMSSAALGKPLPASDLEVGTVTVRVVKGTPEEPYVGVDVELRKADGATRSARTDAAGRARFVGLEPGSSYVAHVGTEEGEAETDQFQVPSSGGLKFMVSPAPWQGGGAMEAAPAGGEGGMPSPRARSGRPIPGGESPAGALSVLAVHGSQSAPAAGEVIKLVGYDGKGHVSIQKKKADEAGRVTFEGLRQDTAYYAMAVLEHDGGYDRVRSVAVTMLPRVGSRLILSGDPGGEAVDDLGRMVEPQPDPPLPPGEVLVRLRGGVEQVREVELVEVGKPDVVAKAPARQPRVDEDSITGRFLDPVPEAEGPTGSLAIVGARRVGDQPQPVPGVQVEIRPATEVAGGDVDDDAAEDEGDGVADGGGDETAGESDGEVFEATSDDKGLAVVRDLEPGARYHVSATLRGRSFETELTLPEKGGMRAILMTQWDVSAPLEARFTGLPASSDTVYAAQIRDGDEVYRSAPFQLTPDRGAAVYVLVFPKLVFGFHLGGFLDNEYMGFQGQFVLQNFSFAPHDPGAEGLDIPLPKGFVGAQVGEEDNERVTVTDRGFLWRGVVPPGGGQFVAGFSLPTSGGTVDFDMPLPYGAFDSNLNIIHTPGMKIDAPTSKEPRLVERNGRKFYAVGGITILPEQRMVMSIRGLPHHGPWRRRVQYAVGVVALAILGWAMFTVLSPSRRRRIAEIEAERADVERRRDALLDQLVALERRHDDGDLGDERYERERRKLRRQLEQVYARLRGGTSEAA